MTRLMLRWVLTRMRARRRAGIDTTVRFSEWMILADLGIPPGGSEMSLRGDVAPDQRWACPTVLDMLNAAAQGATAAGYPARVVVVNEDVSA